MVLDLAFGLCKKAEADRDRWRGRGHANGEGAHTTRAAGSEAGCRFERFRTSASDRFLAPGPASRATNGRVTGDQGLAW
jgi:hypothetical protein